MLLLLLLDLNLARIVDVVVFVALCVTTKLQIASFRALELGKRISDEKTCSTFGTTKRISWVVIPPSTYLSVANSPRCRSVQKMRPLGFGVSQELAIANNRTKFGPFSFVRNGQYLKNI
jgi:hypothetical protein